MTRTERDARIKQLQMEIDNLQKAPVTEAGWWVVMIEKKKETRYARLLTFLGPRAEYYVATGHPYFLIWVADGKEDDRIEVAIR